MENLVEVNVGDVVHVKDQFDREFTGFVVENTTSTPGHIFIVKLLEGLADNQHKITEESLGLNNDGWLVQGKRVSEVTVLEHAEIVSNINMLTESLDDDHVFENCTVYRTKNPLTESYITMCRNNRNKHIGISFANTLTESISEASSFMRGE